MEKSINAVGFTLEQKQSDMIDSKLKRIAYAEDLIVNLTMRIKHDKAYSVELIKNHLINSLKEILDNYACQIKIDYNGTADSCDKIESFLQAE